MSDTPIADAIAMHLAGCKRCTPWSPCTEGAELLAKLTAKLTPEVLDLDGHRAGCVECRERLCPVARRLLDEMGSAYEDAGVKRPTGKPC